MEQKILWDQEFKQNSYNEEESFLKDYTKYFRDKNSKILDLGCGSGNNALYLYNLGFDIVAADFSQSALQILQAKENDIATACFDMTQTFPWATKSFDVIVASLSTHYFSRQITAQVYAQIYACLKNKGYFVFRVNSYKELEFNDKGNIIAQIEADFYKLASGKTKRYFSLASMTDLLGKYSIIDIAEVQFKYNNNVKYAIQGIAQK